MNSLTKWNLILIATTAALFPGNKAFAQDNKALAQDNKALAQDNKALAKDNKSATAIAHSVDRLNWMAGNWIRESRLNDKIMSTVEEQWMKPKGDLMLGVNRSVQSDGRTAFEFMRIAKTDQGIIFFASPGGKPAVGFTLTSLTDKRVVFENPDHDFPQRVIYGRDGDQLIGRIEGMIDGQEKSVEWKFLAAQ